MPDVKELTEFQQKNRLRFFDSSEPLFERYGYKKTTVQDICQGAGLSKPTFYDLFNDKADLFAQLLMHLAETGMKEWESGLPKKLNPVQKLLSFIDLYEKLCATKPIYKHVFEDPTIIEKFSWMLYSTPHSPVLTSLHRILDEGIQSEHFRRFDPEAAVWMIYSLLDSMYILLPMITREPGAGENPKLAKEIRLFILKGLGVYNGF